MKLLPLALLFSITCFSQTGKYDNNTSIQIYFSEGNIEIKNTNTCRSTVQIAFMGDTTIVELNNWQAHKFYTDKKDFILSARNLTLCEYTDQTEWVTVDSKIRAVVIKNKINSKLIKTTICNDSQTKH